MRRSKIRDLSHRAATEGDGDGLPIALFREEALKHHQLGLRSEGDVLRADPGWMRWTYRLLLAALAAGLLFSLLARVGEYAAGPAVVHLKGRPEVIAFVPVEYRPLLEPGMPLRLELQGYRYVSQHLVVDSVADEVEPPGVMRLNGPVVRVSARLPAAGFEADGRLIRYYDGMLGRAEVRLRSERMLVVLVPALKALFERRQAGDA